MTIQLLVKAKALNSKLSMGVAHLLEPQVWDTSGVCAVSISLVGIYLPLAYLDIAGLYFCLSSWPQVSWDINVS